MCNGIQYVFLGDTVVHDPLGDQDQDIKYRPDFDVVIFIMEGAKAKWPHSEIITKIAKITILK